MTKLNGKEIRITLSEEEINTRLDQIESLACDDELKLFLTNTLKVLIRLDEIIGMQSTTIARLRKIFGKKSEKRNTDANDIDKAESDECNESNDSNDGNDNPKDNKKNEPEGKGGRKKGQGNNGQNQYPNAPRISHGLDDNQKPGNKCPDCEIGTLYKYEPGIYIRVTGSPLLKAKINETEKSRCNACGKIFEANFEGKTEGKYSYTAKSIIAIIHYLASLPFYRLQKIQKNLLTPMPRSVQWKLMEELADLLIYIWKALIKFGREGELFYLDDTTSKILSVIKKNKGKEKGKDRTGMFTTGIIAESDKIKCILFFTGQKYSGENFDEFIEGRNSDGPIKIMSDALKNNNPKKVKEIVKLLCLVHGRRQFIDIDNKFKEESEFVLEKIGKIYKFESDCKEKNLTPLERMQYHQKNSGPIMDALYEWCKKSIDDKIVEPNSVLGKGIKYLLNHWTGLTGFLKIEGAPLDNNLLESHLRVPVLNRKNWLFYKNEMGALVGDIILSILKTCEMNKVDPYQYLNFIQENQIAVKENPDEFLPWKIVDRF